MCSPLPPGFLWWCHNISTVVNWELPPPRTGRAQLTHPAPHQHLRTCVRCRPPRLALGIRRCVRQVPKSTGVLAWPPSLHSHYRASFPQLGRLAATVLCGLPTSHCLLRSSPLRLVRAYSSRRNWSSRRSRAVGISLVALLTSCVARMGLRPRASCNRSPVTRPPVLPSSVNKPWAGSESYKFSGLNTIHGWTASPVHSSSLPFRVRFNVPVTSRAATLDTGPGASGYPGGIRTRWPTSHFQYARSRPCSSAFALRDGRPRRLTSH